MKCSTRAGLLATASSLLLALPASAALIAADGFNYTANSELHGQSGGQGWSASSSWSTPTASHRDNVTIVNSSLSYSGGSVSISGGSTAMQVTGGVSAASTLGTRLLSTSADVVYWSFLVNPVAIAGDNTLGVRLGPDADRNRSGSVGYNGTQNFSANLYANSATNDSDSVAFGAVNGVTYFVVAKIYKSVPGGNYDLLEMFVNPTSNTTEGGTYEFLNPLSMNTTSGTLGAFTMVVGGMNAAEDTLRIDELKVTTTWAEAVSPIPEPSVAMLGLLGGLLAFRRRRA